MNSVVGAIKDFFEKGDMQYKYNEEKQLFRSGVDMQSALGNIDLIISVKENSYVVYAVMNSKAEKNLYNQVAEFLHRANYGMLNGNFEFDYSDGEIRYKTYVNCDGIHPSSNVVADSILLPIIIFERYGKHLLNVMLGNGSPEEEIEKAEQILDFISSDER